MTLPSFAWARPVTLKADDILNLPEYTFGLHTKKRGFVPITCAKDILTAIPQRDSLEALKAEMEAKYGTGGAHASGGRSGGRLSGSGAGCSRYSFRGSGRRWIGTSARG